MDICVCMCLCLMMAKICGNNAEAAASHKQSPQHSHYCVGSNVPHTTHTHKSVGSNTAVHASLWHKIAKDITAVGCTYIHTYRCMRLCRCACYISHSLAAYLHASYRTYVPQEVGIQLHCARLHSSKANNFSREWIHFCIRFDVTHHWWHSCVSEMYWAIWLCTFSIYNTHIYLFAYYNQTQNLMQHQIFHQIITPNSFGSKKFRKKR